MGCQKFTSLILLFDPILAAYKTLSYSLAKFLVPLLQKYAINEHHVQNSFEFHKSVLTMNLPSTPYLASFDVHSLFLNIPLDETIDLICNTIFEYQAKFHNMSAAELKRTISVAYKDVICLSLTTCFTHR